MIDEYPRKQNCLYKIRNFTARSTNKRYTNL